MKRALITGITGQDGSYLAEFLLEKGYKVFGLERRTSSKIRVNIGHIENQVNFISGDLTDQHSLTRAIWAVQPDEVYNLAAQSFVKESWDQPEYTGNVTGLGALRMLEAIRQINLKIKYYQASSSEMFGRVVETPQNEKTPFYPRSPYGVAKLYAHWITVNYRESYNMFACSGILFNHESERRGVEFVTRKITDAAAMIKLGLQNKLYLGNLDAKRDWGYAPEYVEAMWLMLQQERAEDFIIATGKTHSVKDFVRAAFEAVDLDWHKYVEIDEQFKRPAEVELLVGDPTKAKEKLGWQSKVSFKELVEKMVKSDLKRIKGKITFFKRHNFMKDKDVILLPTYNERENVRLIIPEIFEILPGISIMVIDDNSPDGTAEVVRELMKSYPNLSILERSEKTGLGDAYIEGMKKVIKDRSIRSVITMDSDGSHQSGYLKDFIDNIKNYDLVIGSRYIKGGGVENWEFWRKILSKFGNTYAKVLTGLQINDFTAGFMCIRREILEKFDFDNISSTGYSFLIELKFYLINKLKARAKEMPIIFKSRREGESKLSNKIIKEGIKTPLMLFVKRIWKK